VNELVELAQEVKLQGADVMIAQIEAAATILADALGAHLGLDNTDATDDIGGIMVSFNLVNGSDEWPEAIRPYDPDCDA